MKPYIAILIDSFWEAIGNKVLWALLLGWSVVLLGLAPFGYITERSFQLSSGDISRDTELIEKLGKGARGRESLAIQAVAARLEADFRQKLPAPSNESSGQRRIRGSELAKALNVVLASKDLYSEEAFPTAQRRERLLPLIETRDSLPPEDLEELNRELLQLAFPLELNRPRSQQLWIGYGSLKLGEPLPISKRQISEFLEPILLTAIIKLGLGVLAIFVAIVVTSPIIPDTFRSGSLHLLLSKPISRVWLYLAKFFGGCIFVLVNITFVLIGLYIIAGTRFEIWNAGLLGCIPLLMFVFIIFYSVSTFTGLLWGNAIVSVVACMVFWLFCFAVGGVHEAMKGEMEIMPQISRIRPVEDHLLAVTEEGQLVVWSERFSVWQPASESERRGQVRTFGPIYDPEQQQIIVKSFFRNPFGGLAARSRNLSLIRLAKNDGAEEIQNEPLDAGEAGIEDSLSSEQPAAANKEQDSTPDDEPTTASEARDTPRWMSDSGPELPVQMFDLLELQNSLVAVCRGGLFQLDFKKLQIIQRSNNGLFGLKIPWMVTNAFENIAPKDYFLSENTSASATADSSGLAIFNSGNIDHLVLEGGKFKLQATTKLDGEADGTEAALVQMNANFCVVARNAMPLTILSAELKHLADVELPKDENVRQIAWIPRKDELAIITHTGHFLRLDCAAASLASTEIPFDGQFTSMTWPDQNHVWMGVKPNRVYLMNATTEQVEQSFVPAASIWDTIFRWGVKPIYYVNPKPAALDNAMTYLLSGNKTQALGIVTNDLEAAQLELDIWQPIFTNLAFVIFMLGVGSVYVARKEF